MLQLYKNGYCIALPEKPTCLEKFAAAELEKYLQRLLEKTPEAPEASSPVRIALGSPLRNQVSAELMTEEDWKALDLGPEGFAVLISESGIVIAGAEGFDDDGRGTLYGVYDFLEQKLGCCLAVYTKAGVPGGESIPELTEAPQPEVSAVIHQQADNAYRCAIVQYNNWAGNPHHELNIEFIDWLAKNRYNRILTWTSIYDEYKKMGLTEELQKRGIRMSVGHHESARTWLPFYGNALFPEHYRETHPEYFRLNADGTRYTPKGPGDMEGQWIYCSRNPEVVETVSKNLITWIRENPVVDTIAFWPNDSMSESCCCEQCRKYSKTENYAYFENEVAKRVSEACPGVSIDMLVYQDLWKFPEGMKLSKNLVIDESTWAEDGLRYVGASDGSGLKDTEFERNLLEWHGSGATAVYYDYFMGIFGNRQRLIPMASELPAMWKRFMEVGIAGSGTQLECFHVWNHLVNLTGFGRIGYDTSITLEELISFLGRLFGKGGKAVGEAVRLMEGTLNGQVRNDQGGIYTIQHIDKEKVYALFDEALAAAETPAAHNNVRLMRMVFRYSDLEVNDPSRTWKWAKHSVMPYEDPTGELRYMANHFDSYQPDPAVGHGSGYGICVPVEQGETPFDGNDPWYRFE